MGKLQQEQIVKISQFVNACATKYTYYIKINTLLKKKNNNKKNTFTKHIVLKKQLQ